MSERWPMFDIKRDKAIIEVGGFWCSSCLVGRPVSEQSPDPRYCTKCYELLLEDAALLPGKSKKADWIPCQDTVLSGCAPSPVGDKDCDKVTLEVFQGAQGVTDPMTGRIRVLAGQGMFCRAIEKELAAAGGVTISYRTIHRRLQRSMAL